MRVVEARRPLGSDFSDGRLVAIGRGEQVADLDAAGGLELAVDVEVVACGISDHN
jgi:hypothetical protein